MSRSPIKKRVGRRTATRGERDDAPDLTAKNRVHRGKSFFVDGALRTKIVKRDGRVQRFNRTKLTRSMIRAGATKSQANLVSSRVVNRLGSRKSVTSKQLSSVTARSLSRVNSTASRNYVSYRDKRAPSIYHAMDARARLAHDVKKDKFREVKTARAQKFAAEVAACNVKKEEIEKKLEQAKDQFASACTMAVATAVGSVTGESEEELSAKEARLNELKMLLNKISVDVESIRARIRDFKL